MSMSSNIDIKKTKKILLLIKDTSISKITVLKKTLQSCNYHELEYLYEKTPHIYKGLFSLSYLKRKDYSQLFKNNIQPDSEIIDYIGKITFVLKHHYKDINSYIEKRFNIDRLVLSGEYEKANLLIDSINKEISYSYWAAAYRIKIDRIHKGNKTAVETHNNIFYKNDHYLFRKYCNAAYYTSSLDFSEEIYDKVYFSEDDDFLKKINIIIKSHFFAFEGIGEGSWVNADMSSSIIDLYNHFINILPTLSKETISENEFREYMKIISEIIDEPYIFKLCNLWGIITKKIYNSNDNRIAILNSYFAQDYQKVIDLSIDYLSLNESDVEIFITYTKSLILLGKKPLEYHNDGTLLEKIKYHITKFFEQDKEKVYHLRKLMGICRAFYHIPEIRFLFSILKGIESNDILNMWSNCWKYSQYQNIYDIVYYDKREEKINYLLSIGINEFEIQNLNTETAIGKDCFELSLGFNSNGSKVSLLSEKLTEQSLIPYLNDAAVRYCFESYIQSNDTSNAVSFYVNYILYNESLTFKPKDSHIKIILEEYDNQIDIDALDFAIFMYFVNVDDDTLYLAYKKSLTILGVKRASEIKIEGKKKIDFFLSHIATPKIITLHVLKFKSVEQVLQERLTICTNLNNYYDKKQFADEIAGIVRDLKMLELNNKIDDNKIYVDVQSIKESELTEAKAIYKMYEQSALDENVLQDTISQIVESLKMSGMSIDILVTSHDKNSDKLEYQYETLKRMFIYVRDQFLFNPKSGLDNYLSTRIRHGTLINQLRNHYEIDNLITNITNGKYISNKYWLDYMSNVSNSSTLSTCDNFFKKFAENTDNLIFEIKEEYVQVSTESNKTKINACFNYNIEYFSPEIKKLQKRTELNSYDAMLSEMINLLWSHTDKCLEDVKNKLQETKQKMLEQLHDLEKNIITITNLPNQVKNMFHDTIVKCSGEIQDDIQVVTRWFNRGSSVNFDFTIQQVIDTCISYINNNSKYTLKTNIECQSTTSIQGKYFSTLYDMFHDIMNNVMYYERNKGLHNTCSIEVLEINNILNIRVSNPVDISEEGTIKNKVKEINKNLETLLRAGKSRVEGNSGCIKIFNAVHNHLGSNKNDYINSVENGNFIVKICIDLIALKA